MRIKIPNLDGYDEGDPDETVFEFQDCEYVAAWNKLPTVPDISIWADAFGPPTVICSFNVPVGNVSAVEFNDDEFSRFVMRDTQEWAIGQMDHPELLADEQWMTEGLPLPTDLLKVKAL